MIKVLLLVDLIVFIFLISCEKKREKVGDNGRCLFALELQ